jgi:hypothetical protein
MWTYLGRTISLSKTCSSCSHDPIDFFKCSPSADNRLYGPDIIWDDGRLDDGACRCFQCLACSRTGFICGRVFGGRIANYSCVLSL